MSPQCRRWMQSWHPPYPSLPLSSSSSSSGAFAGGHWGEEGRRPTGDLLWRHMVGCGLCWCCTQGGCDARLPRGVCSWGNVRGRSIGFAACTPLPLGLGSSITSIGGAVLVHPDGVCVCARGGEGGGRAPACSRLWGCWGHADGLV